MGNTQGILTDNLTASANATKFTQSIRVKTRAIAKFLTAAQQRRGEDKINGMDGTSSHGGSCGGGGGGDSRRSSITGDVRDKNECDIDEVDGDFTNVLLINAFDKEQSDDIIDTGINRQLLNENVDGIDVMDDGKIAQIESKPSVDMVRNIVSGELAFFSIVYLQMNWIMLLLLVPFGM